MINVSQVCHEWLKTKEKTVKTITYEKYEKAINKYVIPFYRTHPFSSLDEKQITDYLYAQYDKNLSNSTINFIRITICSVYEYAVEYYNCRPLNFNKISFHVENSKKSVDTLGEEEESLLYQYCMYHLNALSVSILLALYAGLRCSEICSLQIQDVHLDEGYIDVNKKSQRNVNYLNNDSKTLFHTIELTWPEKRQVVLLPFIVDYLRKYIGDEDGEYYLLSRTTKLSENRLYQSKLKKLGKELGFDVNYSVLRNTCKNKCINNNMNVKSILNMLGMSKIEITIDNNYHEGMDNMRSQMYKIQPDL
ncbi:MAG: site-specific integrase [Erysipelotrichaceae bacterium]|nr:site-specific integrase [Erysipelotrichaceae bacterium]